MLWRKSLQKDKSGKRIHTMWGCLVVGQPHIVLIHINYPPLCCIMIYHVYFVVNIIEKSATTYSFMLDNIFPQYPSNPICIHSFLHNSSVLHRLFHFKSLLQPVIMIPTPKKEAIRLKAHQSISYGISIVFAVLAASLRYWNLCAAVDDSGLPVMHISVYILLGISILFVILAIFQSVTSPGRSSNYIVLQNRAIPACGMCGAVLIGLGACTEFAEALVSGPSITDPIMLLTGLLGAISCLCVLSLRRTHNQRYPLAELLPIVYLVIKLILNFKDWNTDPIIGDYCITLFALIFALLAVYCQAGFIFDRGHPRRTLFCSMMAVYFCGAALADGICDRDYAAVVFYAGLLLWNLPSLKQLPIPSNSANTHDDPEKQAPFAF